ncbi:MAG: ABC transporter ATP-binding protein [Candidatus Methanoplasma sp.]|jgi:putative ABC transport system ATP-binding protein|nr:ABC transporter ATP-binding protein [Candidatus Methanoplasma sp.]
MPLLEIKDLTKEYKRGTRTFNVLDNVNLTMESDDFITLIGRSGSGKSTLLNIVAGLLKPTGGSVTYDGKNIFELNDKDGSFFRNSKIGYIPQGHSLLANLNVLDNVRLPYNIFKREGDATERALNLLELTGISPLAESFPRHLSGGEQRRVSIARALINSPSIIVADEPTSDLDVDTTKEIMELLRSINDSGTAIFMVTHELDTIGYGKRLYSMDAGRLTEKNVYGTAVSYA